MAVEQQGLAVPTTSDYQILKTGDAGSIAEILAENAGEGGISPFELTQVRVPAGGGTTWTIPSIDGDQEVKSFEGIIAYQRQVRAYYQSEEAAEGTPPDCSSHDMEWGVGSPGGDCAACPLSQWGSGKGQRGQACKTNQLLLVFTPDAFLPMVVKAPPGSLKGVRQYMLGLASKGVRYSAAVTRFELVQTKTPEGQKYAVIKPSLVRALSPEEAGQMRQTGEALRGIFKTASYSADAA